MRLLSLCLLLLLSGLANAGDGRRVYYGDGLHSANWLPVIAPGVAQGCHLRGEIPGYGAAQFSQLANRQTSFRLLPYQVQGSAEVRLLSAPPPWRHGAAPEFLATLHQQPGVAGLQMNQTLSQRLLQELSAGMSPMLVFAEPAQARVVLFLSPFQFRPALDEFHRCTAALMR